MPVILANPNSNIEKTYCLNITSLVHYTGWQVAWQARLMGPTIMCRHQSTQTKQIQLAYRETRVNQVVEPQIPDASMAGVYLT